jgi:hypothetical protein
MNGHGEIHYTLELGLERRPRIPVDCEPIPRIARLLALAIRLDGLIRDQDLASYAEIARRGPVTRARMTQIMKLLHLAPDIQEQILFLPPTPGLNERNLRPVTKAVDWAEQRQLFQALMQESSRRLNQGITHWAPPVRAPGSSADQASTFR